MDIKRELESIKHHQRKQAAAKKKLLDHDDVKTFKANYDSFDSMPVGEQRKLMRTLLKVLLDNA